MATTRSGESRHTPRLASPLLSVIRLRALQGNAAAGYRWLRPRLGPDGRWQDEPGQFVDCYYKLPWFLAEVGDPDAALANLAHIERSFLQPDGDLAPINSETLQRRYPLVPHAHVAIGATLLGRDDLANRLLDFMAQQRDPELRAWGDRADGRRQQQFDAISTACIGLAFLEAGRHGEAHDAGAFLDRLLDCQPQPATDLFTTLLSSGDLLTEFPDKTTTVERRVTFASRFQVWHALGFPIMLLARLYETDGDPSWLRSADRFVAMYDRSGQAWIDLATGKAAYGFAILYRATGDKAYRERAQRATRGLVSWQDRDGAWLTCLEGQGGTADAATSMGYEVCTEIAMWLDVIGEILSEEDGVSWRPPTDANGHRHFERWAGEVNRITARERRLAPVRRRRLRGRTRRVLDLAKRS